MIKSDSRRIVPGDIFIALPGIKSDGHDYVDDAINRGAVKVIVEHGSYSVQTLVVPDTRSYLKEYLATTYRDIINDMTIIGVTGTNGKTTISYFIYQALNKLGRNCSMIGTLGYYKESKVGNLYNTCPDIALMYELIIDSYNSGYKCVVLEASSQGLSLDRLYGILFDFAIFTNLTHDHLDYHGSFENYALAKRKLFLQLRDSGIGIVNVDDAYRYYFNCPNLVTYGFGICNYRIISYDSKCFCFSDGVKHSFFHSLIGKYNIYNLMASIIVLVKMGYSYDVLHDVISNIRCPLGRMEVYNYKSSRIIVDYAHTPDAISKVIDALDDYNNLYVVFGCTGNRDRLKRPIMTKLVMERSKYFIITSDDLYDEDFDSIVSDMIGGNSFSNYSVIRDRGEAILKGISMLGNNDVLLVLGKGHEEFLKIGNSRIPFNDGRFILDFINKSI